MNQVKLMEIMKYWLQLITCWGHFCQRQKLKQTEYCLDTEEETVKSHGLDLVLETDLRGWELFISSCTFAS